MAIFNPSVPNVGPGDYDVTKPISKPEPNTALGTLFTGVGKGLGELGQMVTDATKLQDFTNKEDISNRVLISANAEREANTAKLAELAVQTGTPANMVEPGARGEIPDGLKGFQKTVGTMAAAKADAGVLDVYYKSRIDMLAKQYRSAYPQYTDYIDHVFSKAGFGTPANEYMHALQAQFLKNQAALGTKDTETTALLKDGLDKYGYPFNELAQRHRAGEDVYTQASNEFAKRSSNKYQTQLERDAYSLDKESRESRKEAIGELTTNSQQRVISSELNSKATPTSLGSVIDRVQNTMRGPEPPNPDQVAQDTSLITEHINRLRDQLRIQGNEPHDYKNPITGTTTRITDRDVMGGTTYDAQTENTLKYLSDIRDSLTNHDYGAATFSARLVQGWTSDTARFLYAQPNLRGNLLLLDFVKGFPESAREIMQGIFRDVSTANMPADLAGAANSHAIAFFNNGPEPAKKAVETMAGYKNNPASNNFILDQSQHILNKKIDPQLRTNAVEAFFGPKNAGITDGMSTNKAATYFATVTDPKYVDAIHELGPKAVEMHKTWVENEVHRLFSRDFQELPEMEKGFKVHYNPDEHQFGLDYGKYKNINRWPPSAVEKLFAPSSATDILASGNASRVAAYTKTLDSVNSAAGGLANIALASKADPNAYLFKNIAVTQNTQNPFWKSIQGQAEQYKVQPTEDAPNLKTPGLP